MHTGSGGQASPVHAQSPLSMQVQKPQPSGLWRVAPGVHSVGGGIVVGPGGVMPPPVPLPPVPSLPPLPQPSSVHAHAPSVHVHVLQPSSAGR
jgi:hypothetical protein